MRSSKGRVPFLPRKLVSCRNHKVSDSDLLVDLPLLVGILILTDGPWDVVLSNLNALTMLR